MHLLGPTLFLHRLWCSQGLSRSAGEYFFYEWEWVKQVSPEARQAGTAGQNDTEQLNNPMRNGEENQGYILLERIEVEEDQVYWWKLGQPCLRLGGVSRANTDAHTHTHAHDSERRGEQIEGRSEPERGMGPWHLVLILFSFSCLATEQRLWPL